MLKFLNGFLIVSCALVAIASDKPDDAAGLPTAKRVEAVIIDLSKNSQQILASKAATKIKSVEGWDPGILQITEFVDSANKPSPN